MFRAPFCAYTTVINDAPGVFTEATVLLGALEMVLWLCPYLCLTTKFIVEVDRKSLGHRGLILVLTCSMNCGTVHVQVGAFLNYVQSFSSTGFKSSTRLISSKQVPDQNLESQSTVCY